MNDNPPKIYRPGESFMEKPGCHHTVGDNNLGDKSTRFTAIFVIDTEVVKTGGYEALVVLDDGYSE